MLFGIICAVSAGIAVFEWLSQGFCVDSALPSAVAVLSLISVFVIIQNERICRSEKELAEQDVYLRMVSGPSQRERKPVKGKMPNQKGL